MTLWEQRKKQVGEFWKKYKGSKEHRKVEYELNKKHNPNFEKWITN